VGLAEGFAVGALVGARVGAALLTNPENSNRHKMLSNGANFEKLIIAILTR
jgi:gas vesicle protein